MNSDKASRRNRAGRLVLALAVFMANAAYAQEVNFNIPGGDLKAALDAYIRQTGQQIVYRSEDAKGQQSTGAHGSMSAEQALTAILAGTNLQVRRDSSGAIVLFSGEAGAADASSGEAGGKDQLEQIIVTATMISQVNVTSRTATRLDADPMLVPMSVSSVQGDLLRNQQAASLTDVVNNVSGVTTSGTGVVTARGFEVTGARNGTSFSGIVNANSANGDLAFRPVVATERVEVLKGPAQILQGSTAGIGGLVNVVTKVPTEAQYVFLGTALGSDSYSRFDLDANSTLADGKYGRLMGEVIGSTEDQSGRMGTQGPSQDFYSGGLRWTNTEFGSDLSAVYERTSRQRGAQLTVLDGENIRDGAPEYVLGDRQSYSHLTSNLVDVHYQQRIAGSWFADTTYNWRDENGDSYGFGWRGDFANPDVILASQLRSLSAGLHTTSETFRVGLHGQFDTWQVTHKLLVSYDYASRNYHDPGVAVLGTYSNNIPNGTQTFVPCTSYCSYSGYADSGNQKGGLLIDQISWQRWHFLLGVRRLTDEDSFVAGGVVYRQDADATLPQFGVVYAVNSALSLYASGNQGFNSNPDIFDENGQPLPNTTYTQYEGGAKYLLLGEKLALTAALYQIKQKDIPEFVGYTPQFMPYYKSIPGITSKGVDLELAGQPVRGLDLRVAYAYLNSSDDTTGEPPFEGYPPNKFSVWSQFWFSRNTGHGWWVGGGLATVDTPKRQADTGKYSGNTIVDLSAGWQNEHWQAIMGAKNISNNQGYYPLGGGAVYGSNFYTANRVPRRAYRFDLNYRF